MDRTAPDCFVISRSVREPAGSRPRVQGKVRAESPGCKHCVSESRPSCHTDVTSAGAAGLTTLQGTGTRLSRRFSVQLPGLRFDQWILDTAKAEYNQTRLDYQYEIGLRHHPSKKNKTDNGHTLGPTRARGLIAFSAAIVAPMKPYLEKGGHIGGCRQSHVRRLVEVDDPTGLALDSALMREGDF
jgi:hypothetical protein